MFLDTEDFFLIMDYEEIFNVIGELVKEIAIYVLDHEGRKMERICFNLEKIRKELREIGDTE